MHISIRTRKPLASHTLLLSQFVKFKKIKCWSSWPHHDRSLCKDNRISALACKHLSFKKKKPKIWLLNSKKKTCLCAFYSHEKSCQKGNYNVRILLVPSVSWTCEPLDKFFMSIHVWCIRSPAMKWPQGMHISLLLLGQTKYLYSQCESPANFCIKFSTHVWWALWSDFGENSGTCRLSLVGPCWLSLLNITSTWRCQLACNWRIESQLALRSSEISPEKIDLFSNFTQIINLRTLHHACHKQVGHSEIDYRHWSHVENHGLDDSQVHWPKFLDKKKKNVAA